GGARSEPARSVRAPPRPARLFLLAPGFLDHPHRRDLARAPGAGEDRRIRGRPDPRKPVLRREEHGLPDPRRAGCAGRELPPPRRPARSDAGDFPGPGSGEAGAGDPRRMPRRPRLRGPRGPQVRAPAPPRLELVTVTNSNEDPYWNHRP